MTEIWKFQRSADGRSILAYTEGRRTCLALCGSHAEAIYKALKIKPMGKQFAAAKVDKAGNLHLGEALEDQGW